MTRKENMTIPIPFHSRSNLFGFNPKSNSRTCAVEKEEIVSAQGEVKQQVLKLPLNAQQ